MGSYRLLSPFLALLLVALITGACSLVTFTTPKPPKLKGERIPIMIQGANLKTDEALSEKPVTIAPPLANVAWPQAGGVATHAPYHLVLSAAPRRIFKVSAGRGSSSDRRLLAQPVMDRQGRLFVLDAYARVYVFNADNGRRIWHRDLRPKSERDGTLGAGMAVAGGRLFVTTGFAQAFALDARNGRILWRTKLTAPMRAAPTYADGRVIVVSTDNRTHALDATTGKVLWSHRGATEQASLLGSAAPAYENGILVVAYSSGELFGLRIKDGKVAWQDFLAQRRRTSGIGTIADIRASPVIDRGRVFAVSNSARLVSVSLATGARIWQRRIGATQSPWVAGKFLYLVTNENMLLCLSREDGRIAWGRSLPRYKDLKKRRDWISWSGPVLAGDRLILAGSNREVLAISPYSGDLLGRIKVPDAVEVSPIVARGTLYLLTSDADLIALR
jgi:outer membrane protein assembly factor BamB